MARLIVWLLTLAVSVARGHPRCERGAPDHGGARVILQRSAGVMVTYTCDQGYRRVGHVYSVCLRGVWTTPLPECIPITDHAGEVNDGANQGTAPGPASDWGVLVSHEELPSTQRSIAARKVKHMRKKRKRKRKDKRIDTVATAGSDSSPELKLDSTCLLSTTDGVPKFVRPPKVPNSMGPKFVRRKTGGQKYLVAIYRCVAGYKLHKPHSRSLGCHSGKWVGTLPICLARRKKFGCINGGCDHGCKEIDDKPKCFCFKGFRQNGKHCYDVNECLVGNGGCQQSCHNTPGSFYCGCPPGYRLASDRTSCVDINECVSRNGHGPCQGQCRNVEGSFSCSCEGFPGSRLADDGVSCADIDECTDPGHRLGCSHACVNTRGSAFCLCPPGYQLASDWITCQDINECERGIALCEHECINTIGSFVCTSQSDCHQGYIRVNGSCQDIDECSTGVSACSHGCSNSPGSFTCDCPAGFMLSDDGRTCIDVDECAEFAEGHLCSHDCQNTQGSYSCLCPSDYELATDRRTCHPKEDECQRKNCSHDCVIEDGHVECICDEGYTLEDDISCVDIDECEENLGNCSHSCVNVEGTYYCACPVGYHLLPDKKTCYKKECDLTHCHGCNENGSMSCTCPSGLELIDGNCSDINECDLDTSLCSHLCRNNEGGFECYCRDGFQLDNDQKTCLDIDECLEKDVCSENETCINTEGSYLCNCNLGFRKSNSTGLCEDIDECTFTVDEGSSLCSHICVNSLGSFHCECPPGYIVGKDSRTCEDVDECAENNEINTMCSHECVNTMGSYHWECPVGFKLGEDHICVAASGCDAGNGGCSHICIDNDGYPVCECPEGFVLANGSTTCIPCPDNNCLHPTDAYRCLEGFSYDKDIEKCIDINECNDNNGNCSQRCENTEGSYSCMCFTGFEEDTKSQKCLDVNECSRNISNCDQICINTEGSYKCECYNGYILSDSLTECLDINECVNNTICDQICHNLEGSFKCDCDAGFILSPDGVSCKDINECSLNISKCNQICRNTEGGFSCDCEPGYKLVNGSDCVRENIIAGIEERKCEQTNAIAGKENECCCGTGYVLVNETQCVHVSVCHETFGCDLSLKDSNICQTSEMTPQEESIQQLGCAPPPSGVEFECDSETSPDIREVYPSGITCGVSCSPGYKLDGSRVVTCLNGSWSAFFQCVAHFRPYIRCPPTIRLNLPTGENSTSVRIPQPKTNMDWEKHVTSKPSWGKQLQAILPIGITSVQFSVVSPSSNHMAKCTVSIHVKDVERPKIEPCPEEMKIFFLPGKNSTQVSWTEPVISDNVRVAHIYQSQKPGVVLSRGVHKINYIAADSSGNIATCQFTVNVEDADKTIDHI